MTEEFNLKISEVFSRNGILLTDNQKEKFFVYYNLLIETNNKFNLTTITQLEEVIVKHFLDSVVANKFLKQGAKVIDIGAGAGFPSLPLKIIRPDLKVLMVDSVNKKVGFLQEVITSLDLSDMSTIHSRVEDLANKKEYREQFDYCLSRAVANLTTLSEYALPFIKLGGKMIAYKSSDIQDELNESKKAIDILGGVLKEVKTLNVEGVERKFVFINKIKNTPSKYPRNGNKPRISPIV